MRRFQKRSQPPDAPFSKTKPTSRCTAITNEANLPMRRVQKRSQPLNAPRSETKPTPQCAAFRNEANPSMRRIQKRSQPLDAPYSETKPSMRSSLMGSIRKVRSLCGVVPVTVGAPRRQEGEERDQTGISFLLPFSCLPFECKTTPAPEWCGGRLAQLKRAGGLVTQLPEGFEKSRPLVAGGAGGGGRRRSGGRGSGGHSRSRGRGSRRSNFRGGRGFVTMHRDRSRGHAAGGHRGRGGVGRAKRLAGAKRLTRAVRLTRAERLRAAVAALRAGALVRRGGGTIIASGLAARAALVAPYPLLF